MTSVKYYEHEALITGWSVLIKNSVRVFKLANAHMYGGRQGDCVCGLSKFGFSVEGREATEILFSGGRGWSSGGLNDYLYDYLLP